MKTFEYQNAINYSGYRKGQSPGKRIYPSKAEIKEDLMLLEGEFYYLRIYDCSPHAYRTLEIIDENNMNFKVMLGLFLKAEENHIDHPFFWKHTEEELIKFKKQNKERVQEIIDLGNKYKHIVSAISIGNETRSIWNNNRIPVKRLVEVTKQIKAETTVPVTFCEEYQHWLSGLEELAETVDFISLHTYPAWQLIPIDQALDKAVENFHQVQNKYPDKYCIITETGWPTKSHGSRIKVEDATIQNQKIYNKQITDWGKENNTLIYLFEAFDEPWKGENNPDEPEKHWGIYYLDRTKK